MDGCAKHHLVTKSADLVGFIREAYSQFPGRRSDALHVYPKLIGELLRVLNSAELGWRLQMVLAVHSDCHPVPHGPVLAWQYKGSFRQASDAAGVQIEKCHREINHNHHQLTVSYVGNIITCCDDVSRNNLCHPVRLISQVEEIDDAVSSAKIESDQMAGCFLEALEVAALRAWRRGDAFACVEIKDVFLAGNRSLEFDSFSRADQREIELEAARRSGVVVSIRAFQQDSPAVGAMA